MDELVLDDATLLVIADVINGYCAKQRDIVNNYYAKIITLDSDWQDDDTFSSLVGEIALLKSQAIETVDLINDVYPKYFRARAQHISDRPLYDGLETISFGSEISSIILSSSESSGGSSYSGVLDFYNKNNYGQEDYDTYSKDPKWQQLMFEYMQTVALNKSVDEVVDEKGNLKVMDSLEHLSLSQDQKKLSDQKYESMSKKEQMMFDIQCAQLDLYNYQRAIAEKEISADASTVRKLEERIDELSRTYEQIVAGIYVDNNRKLNKLMGQIAKQTMGLIVELLGNAIGVKLDPITKSSIKEQAGMLGENYGVRAMESMVRVAQLQWGMPRQPIFMDTIEPNEDAAKNVKNKNPKN